MAGLHFLQAVEVGGVLGEKLFCQGLGAKLQWHMRNYNCAGSISLPIIISGFSALALHADIHITAGRAMHSTVSRQSVAYYRGEDLTADTTERSLLDRGSGCLATISFCSVLLVAGGLWYLFAKLFNY